MNELINAIKVKSLDVPKGGAVVVKMDNVSDPASLQVTEKLLRESISRITNTLDVPVIVIPASVDLDTVSHEQLLALGVI